MSDAVTNLDAEDVLNAIRRLVAETHGARPDVKAQPKEVPVANDALVLTPDFRVVQPQGEAESHAEFDDSFVDDAAEQVSQADAPTQQDSAPEDRPAGDDTPSEAAAEPFVLSAEQAVSAEPDAVADDFAALPEAAPETEAAFDAEVHPEADASPADHNDDADASLENAIEDVLADSQEAAEQDAAADAQEADQSWSDALDDTPDAEAAEQVAAMSLEQRIAELEVAVGSADGADDTWEPDGSEDISAEIPDEIPTSFADAGASVLHFRARGEEEAEMNETSDPERASDPSSAEGLNSASAAVSDAAPEGAEADIADAEVIEETPGHADWAKEAVAAPHADVSESDFDAAEDEIDEEEEFGLAGYPEEDMIDEEVLREMVTQMIREELQGAMGERITRNVRRLVRREVQRAMTLRDFD